MKKIILMSIMLTFASCNNEKDKLPIISSLGEQFVDDEQYEFFIEEQIAKAIEKMPKAHQVPVGLKVKNITIGLGLDFRVGVWGAKQNYGTAIEFHMAPEFADQDSRDLYRDQNQKGVSHD
tara:strand:- start:443 stop:805 length:363 start_codon:yes stop_codon:yes gene_type:complete